MPFFLFPFLFFFYLFVYLSFGHPAAYGFPMATIDQSCSCDLCHNCGNTRSLNPLCRARDQTYVLELQRCCLSHCTSAGTPSLSFLNIASEQTSFFFLSFLRAAPVAYGSSKARGQIGAEAAGLHCSYSNMGSEPHLQPTLHLMAKPDP